MRTPFLAILLSILSLPVEAYSTLPTPIVHTAAFTNQALSPFLIDSQGSFRFFDDISLFVSRLYENFTEPEMQDLRRTFRFEKKVWDLAKPELRRLNQLNPGIFQWIKTNGLGYTKWNRARFSGSTVLIRGLLGSDEKTNAILEIFRVAANQAYQLKAGDRGYFASIGHLEHFIEVHERIHIDMQLGRNGAVFQQSLEKNLPSPLTLKHPFIRAIVQEVGRPHVVEVASEKALVEWYLEEFLVVSADRWRRFWNEKEDFLSVLQQSTKLDDEFCAAARHYLSDKVYPWLGQDLVVIQNRHGGVEELIWYSLHYKIGIANTETIIEILNYPALHSVGNPDLKYLLSTWPITANSISNKFDVFLNGELIQNLDAPLANVHQIYLRAKNPVTLSRYPRAAFSFIMAIGAGLLALMSSSRLFADDHLTPSPRPTLQQTLHAA